MSPVTAVAQDRGTVAISTHAERVLEAHAYQGTSNDCGPYCAAMTIRGLTGWPVDPERLARDMGGLRWRDGRPAVWRLPRWATFPWGVAGVLEAHGFRARWRALAEIDTLRRALERGDVVIAVVGGWWPPWGHYVVLLARDPERGWGLADPAHRRGELVWWSDARFRARWRALGRLVVLAEPHGRRPALDARR